VLRLHVPLTGAAAVPALDRLLAVAPFGVHERPDGLVVHARALPPLQEMRAALGVERLDVGEAPEAAAERLAEIARPEPVDGRLLVRAGWMAPLDGVQEVVLADATAFGTGAHPTTRDCLSILLGLEPGGAFADLGCGAGVLAIAAAKLGWSPVSAVDVAERAVAATRANAAANGVTVAVEQADLLTTPPPFGRTVAANVPSHVHPMIAAAWDEPPEALIVSGVHADEREGVERAYGVLGLRIVEERAADPWLTLLLRSGGRRAAGWSAQSLVAVGEGAEVDVPPSDGERVVELGARAAMFDLPGDVRFDVWALDDSLRWAIRGPAGTTMEVEEETRLAAPDPEPGTRPPSVVRIRLVVRTPVISTRVIIHVTVASEEDPGLVRVGGSATAELVAAQS
jgi:ribosomal protein L11 methyltransferase